MKKIYIVIGVIVVFIIVLASHLNFGGTRVVDWEESFNEKSNKPYGISIFYKELNRIFEDKTIRTLYHTAGSYFYANSEDGYGEHVAEGMYMEIGNADHLDYNSIEELLLFVEKGNTVFISDYDIPFTLIDTLNLEIKYAKNEKDSISLMTFTHPDLYNRATQIDRNEGDYYFEGVDNTIHQVLGHTNHHEELVNFVKVPFEEGNFYLHLQPKSFTNYNLLKEENYTYAEGVLSHLPDADIYFDSYLKYQTPYDGGEAEQESELSWFLEQTSFKWAWYVALIFTFLFMVFNAKRRQRIVKIIKPLQNTTVAFVKTISNLYFETQDHNNLIDKKITYFLEKIRNEFNLDTSRLDQEFTERLSLKSGHKKEDIKKTVDYINWLRSKNQLNEANLVSLNKKIEEFYAH